MRSGFRSETMEDIIEIIKEIIDQEGPRYITREPYRVYERLIAKKVEEHRLLQKRGISSGLSFH